MTFKILHLDNCETTQVEFERTITNYCCVDFIVAANKNFKHCKQTIEANHPDITVINLDNVNPALINDIIDFAYKTKIGITDIILVGSNLCEEDYVTYLEKGIRSFLYIDSNSQDIIDCVLHMYKKDPFLSKEFQCNFKRSYFFDKKEIITAFKSLTYKEQIVSRLIISGLTTNEIAEKLNNSKRTIDAHRRNMSEKLGLIGNRNSLSIFLSENQKIYQELFPHQLEKEAV